MESLLNCLYNTGLKFLLPLTPQEMYVTLIEEARNLIGAEYGSVFLWNKTQLRRAYSSIPNDLQIVPRKNGFAKKVFSLGMPIVVNRRKILLYHPEAKKNPVKALVIAPLSYNNDSLGIYVLHSLKKSKFTKEELEILRLFGAIASLSLRKTQLHEEVKEALRIRDLFIALVSHELRTPLTAITIYAQLIKKKLKLVKGPENLWIKELTHETAFLTKLVNDLLHVEVLNSGKFIYSMEECHIKSIIKRVLQEFSIVHPFHTVVFEDRIKGGMDGVRGDVYKLHQALSNILHNAAKFSSPNSKIILTLEKKNGEIVIQVKDFGIGIPKSDLPKIFQGFYKGHKNYQKGMGLGLYVTKTIIDHHKGSVVVDSKEHKGTTVAVTLPMNSV